MKTDVTSMFFNSSIEGKTATPAWGTSIGQSKSRECRIDDFKPEVVNMLVGMTYKAVSDISKLDTSRGSAKREIVLCSLFTDVFINDIKVDNTQFVLLLVREHSDSHEGRLIISYAPYIKYNNISNQHCIDNMRRTLHCEEQGCWFVYDISIRNQSQLYFKAVIVDAENPRNYDKSTTSQFRSSEWNAMIPNEDRILTNDLVSKVNSKNLQQIFYGAPGTGKSHTVKRETAAWEEKERVVRTTFHPDSDYSTFVGAYKPTLKEVYVRDSTGRIVIEKDKPVKEEQISYEFVPQAFLNAYIDAWTNREEPEYLIIEEINRGNCAQIFGDLFQLLDRNNEGYSEYAIKADRDLEIYLNKAFENADIEDYPNVKSGKELLLPNNFYIRATMNTSDQSLFPIDSAFKRRWDWEYEPIKYKNTDWSIEIADNKYSWTSFQKKVNEKIFSDTNSEDKMLGDYFVKANSENVISEKLFVNKVLFYLWNDVCKDGDSDIFKTDDKTDVKFSDLYGDNGTEMLLGMMEHLGVELLEYVADDYIEESESGNPNTLYSINDGEPFRKTYLAAKVFQEYVKLFSWQTASDVLDEWNKKKAEWKNAKISIPKHLIKNAEGYTEYLRSSSNDDAKKKNEGRFESCDYKGETFYLWKGWGDGKNDNITPFMKAVNESDWGITIKRN